MLKFGNLGRDSAVLGLGVVVLSPAAAKLGTKLLLLCCGGIKDLGLSVEADEEGKAPKAKSPANEGRTRRSLAGGTIGGFVVRPEN